MSRALLAVLASACLLAGGCSGDAEPNGPSGAATTVPERTGEPVAVDACGLVSRAAVHDAIGARLRVVGRRLEAPTLPTETCLWGREFSVPVFELRVTPGPVAEDTFEKAFGPGAGGEPERLDGLGTAAYSRTGLTDRTLQVLTDGVVLILEAKDDPGDPLPEDALAEIAATAVEALPAHPELPPGQESLPPCGRVQDRLVSAVLGGEPRLRRRHSGPRGAAMCSWAGLPGSLAVTVHTDPVQVTNFRANLTPRLYTDVPGTGAETYSQKRQAGDLLMFVDDVLVEVETLPGKGHTAADAATREAELRLARGLVAVLG